MKVVKVAQVAVVPQQSHPLFTGPVSRQPIVGRDLSKNFSIKQVNFPPGVRNKLHSHNAEQVLIVTEGRGIVATEKEEVTVEPGDVVYIAARDKHWHGATKNSAYSHIYVMSPEHKTTQFEA